jgi:methyl-accepting chemotaxis protein
MPEQFREFDPDTLGPAISPVAERLIHKIGRVADDLDEMKTAMKELSQSISRLALAEERITQTNAALERSFTVLDKLSARVAELEKKAVAFAQTNQWVDKAVWLIVGGALTTVMLKAGFVK